MKSLVYICIAVGGVIGSWIGSWFDHGNMLGTWGIILGTVGSLAGIWAAVKINSSI